MKVLEKGINPDDIPWIGKCGNCSSRLEAKRYEIAEKHLDGRDIQSGTAECPICLKIVTFHPEKTMLLS